MKNYIVNSIIATIIFFIVSSLIGVILYKYFNLQEAGFITSACSLLCGVIVFCTYLILNAINNFKQQVYDLQAENKKFEQKYIKQKAIEHIE